MITLAAQGWTVTDDPQVSGWTMAATIGKWMFGTIFAPLMAFLGIAYAKRKTIVAEVKTIIEDHETKVMERFDGVVHRVEKLDKKVDLMQRDQEWATAVTAQRLIEHERRMDRIEGR